MNSWSDSMSRKDSVRRVSMEWEKINSKSRPVASWLVPLTRLKYQRDLVSKEHCTFAVKGCKHQCYLMRRTSKLRMTLNTNTASLSAWLWTCQSWLERFHLRNHSLTNLLSCLINQLIINILWYRGVVFFFFGSPGPRSWGWSCRSSCRTCS